MGLRLLHLPRVVTTHRTFVLATLSGISMSISVQTIVKVLCSRHTYLYVGSPTFHLDLTINVILRPWYICVMCNTETVMVGLIYVTESGQATRIVFWLDRATLAVTCRFPSQLGAHFWMPALLFEYHRSY